jgi:hypothetical protein
MAEHEQPEEAPLSHKMALQQALLMGISLCDDDQDMVDELTVLMALVEQMVGCVHFNSAPFTHG